VFIFFLSHGQKERERKKKSENKYARGKKGPKKEPDSLREGEREKREVFRSSSSLSSSSFLAKNIRAAFVAREREKKKKNDDEARGGKRALSSGEKKVRENKNDREREKNK
jgi:hypothetical protein